MLLGDILAGSSRHFLASSTPECSQVSQVFLNQFYVLPPLISHSQLVVLCRLLLLARAGWFLQRLCGISSPPNISPLELCFEMTLIKVCWSGGETDWE